MSANPIVVELARLVTVTKEHRRTLKYAIEIKGNAFRLNDAQRDLVNDAGKNFGCHECKKIVEYDRKQPWIGDHIPPRKLAPRFKAELILKSKNYLLYPQCYSCMHTQAALVTELNSSTGRLRELTTHEIFLLCGGQGESIDGNGNDVTEAQGILIQRNGEQFGCHSCGLDRSADQYFADHFPPSEFMTPYAQAILEIYGLPKPEVWYLLPHCPSCSSKQGGTVRAVLRAAMNEVQVLRYPK